MSKHPLVEVSERVQLGPKGRVAVVFDLDSTLFNVSSRTQWILRKLADEPDFKERFENAARVLREVEVLPQDWGVREVLLRYKIEETSLEFFEHVRMFWRSHFFSNHALEQDQMYPSANEYVTHLQNLGAEIFYLTGRPELAMRTGTLKALKHWNFPLKDESRLIMKPLEVETDEGFKVKVLRGFTTKFDQIWVFENEPVIIQEIRTHLPMIRIVFMDSTHARRADPPNDILRIGMSYSQGWKT